eukprot:gene10768-biopygen12352
MRSSTCWKDRSVFFPARYRGQHGQGPRPFRAGGFPQLPRHSTADGSGTPRQRRGGGTRPDLGAPGRTCNGVPDAPNCDRWDCTTPRAMERCAVRCGTCATPPAAPFVPPSALTAAPSASPHSGTGRRACQTAACLGVATGCATPAPYAKRWCTKEAAAFQQRWSFPKDPDTCRAREHSAEGRCPQHAGGLSSLLPPTSILRGSSALCLHRRRHQRHPLSLQCVWGKEF